MMKKISWGIASLVLLAVAATYIQFQRVNTESAELTDEVRAQASGMFLDLPGGTTHYEIAGPPSGQVVLLVHGFSVPYYIWDTSFHALADAGFRVVRYDLVGRGFSDRPDVPYNGELFEQQIVDLVRALKLKQPIDVIGLSMGGAVVMRYAANHPESVRKIVLLDPAYKASPKQAYPMPLGSLVIALTAIPHMAEGQLTDFLHPENYPTWVDQYREQMQYKGFRRAITSTIYEFSTEDHLSNYVRVQQLGLPVKLIWGVEDRTLDISGADTVQSVLDVDFMPVEDAGHLPHIEKAEIVNSAIVEFLRSESRNRPSDQN